MRKKKLFVAPRVIQEVQIQLEKDLLQDSISLGAKLSSMGQGVETYTLSENPEDTEASYFVEW